MPWKQSKENGVSISAFPRSKFEESPFHDASSAAAALPEAATPTQIPAKIALINTARSSLTLERRSSWLNSALSGDTLPFALIDVEKEERRRCFRSMCLSIGSAIFYSICAISMNFANKAALMVFPYANTLLFLQMLAALAVVLPLKYFGFIYFHPLNAKKAKALLPLTALYAGNVMCALLGLRLLNVPMYSTLKRLTPMVVLLAKWRLTRQLPSKGICLSVLIVVVGCFIAGSGDLAFDIRGYSFAFASCMLQEAYLLLVERTGAKQGVSTSELLAYNAVLSLPFILIVMLLSGEVFTALPALQAAISQHGTTHIIALLIVCSISGVALNFSMFWCTLLNSALTTTIVGTLKGVIVTGLGFFLLGGVKYKSVVNIAGIVVNAVGGTFYSIVKYRAKRRSSCISFSSSSRSTSVSPSLFSQQQNEGVRHMPVSQPSSFSPRHLHGTAHSSTNSSTSSFDDSENSPSLVLDPGYHHLINVCLNTELNTTRHSLDGTMHYLTTGHNYLRKSLDGALYCPSLGKPPLAPKFQQTLEV